MSHQDIPSDKLLSKIACFRQHQFEAIRHQRLKAVTVSSFQRDGSTSSLGTLDRLTPEILLRLADLLDLRSLARLSYVSIKGHSIVQDLPAFEGLIQHAPTIPTALGKSNLSQWHTPKAIYETLETSECVCCEEFGGYLFLPTCERACLNCLATNSCFWMMPLHKAKKRFKVTESEWPLLPKMTRIIDWEDTEKCLVSLQHLLDLWDVKCPDDHIDPEDGAYLMEADQGQYTLSAHVYERHVLKEVSNKAVRIPFLSDDGVQLGVECRECMKYQPGVDFARETSSLYTKAGLLKHCNIYHAQLLKALEKKETETKTSY